jgi:hypothetical protein
MRNIEYSCLTKYMCKKISNIALKDSSFTFILFRYIKWALTLTEHKQCDPEHKLRSEMEQVTAGLTQV